MTAQRLDRFSDWLGGFVPGCARLSVRHPIKVSLVMGLLGLVAGWATMGVVFGLESRLAPNQREAILSLVPGTWLALIVAWPLMVWQRRPVVVCLLAMASAVAAGCFHVMLLEHFGRQGGSDALWAGWAGFLAGFGYALAGYLPNSRRPVWMVLPVPLASAAIHWGIITCLEMDRHWGPLPMQLDQFITFTLVANLFAWLFASVGITFGAALWDRTPVPMFEGHADDSCPENHEQDGP